MLFLISLHLVHLVVTADLRQVEELGWTHNVHPHLICTLLAWVQLRNFPALLGGRRVTVI